MPLMFCLSLLDVISNSSWAEDMYEHFDEVSPIAFMYEQETNKSYRASYAFKIFTCIMNQ